MTLHRGKAGLEAVMEGRIAATANEREFWTPMTATGKTLLPVAGTL